MRRHFICRVLMVCSVLALSAGIIFVQLVWPHDRACAESAVKQEALSHASMKSQVKSETSIESSSFAHEAPSIIVNTPSPPRAEWSTHEKIAWVVQLVFLLFGYSVAIFGYRLLRRIEQHSEMAQATASAALECAQALGLMRQSHYESERPWLLVSVARRGQSEDEFEIQINNRGRMVAEILRVEERIGVSLNRRQLPNEANFARELPEEKNGQLLLVPGESMKLCTVRARDLRWICKDQEQKNQVEMQIQHLFFYGAVIYRGLMSPRLQQEHRTSWCCHYQQDHARCSLTLERIGEYGFHE